MKGIAEFFARIQNAHAKEVFLRQEVQEILKGFNIGIDIGAISFKGGDMVLKGLSQSAKMELFLKKGKILTALEAKDIGRQVKDIRF